MPVHRFSHFNIRSDRPIIEALRQFYVDVLGFRVGERPPFSSRGYWLYLDSLPVVHLVEGDPGDSRRARPDDLIDHVAFECSDIADFHRRLTDAGVTWETTCVPGTRVMQILFHDPAGNKVELQFNEDDD